MYLIAILIFIFSFSYLCTASDDTLKILTPNITVNSDRIIRETYFKFVPASIIDASIIEKINSSQINEVLAFSPGVFIRDYGGMGGLKTISIRGTSAAQSKLLLNGIELNSAQNGSTDIGMIPASMINTIEMTRGGSSIVYGSNAMAGVVNFKSKFQKGSFIQLKAGSYGEKNINLKSDVTFFDFDISSHLEYKESDGDYPFEALQFGETNNFTRNNGDFNQISAAISTDYNYKKGHINFFLLGNSAKRGVPGSVIQGRIENAKARLEENNLISAVTFDLASDNYFLLNSVSFKNSTINYNDPLQIGFGGGTLNSDFHSQDFKLSSKLFFDSFVNNKFSLELSTANLQGDMLQPEVGNFVEKNNFAITYTLDKQFSIFYNNDFKLFGGFRADYYSDLSPNYSPAAGLIYNFKAINSSIIFNYSSNFRIPSFNEMYYLNYGSSNLKPEISRTYNFSINLNKISFIDLSLTYFHILTDNQIQSIPVSPLRWSAANIGHTQTNGLEISANANLIADLLSIHYNYTYQYATDITAGSPFENLLIAYIPQEMLNLYIFATYNNFEFNLSSNYSSFRYSLSNNDLSSILDKYIIVNLSLSYNYKLFNDALKLILDVKNFFDEEYQIIKNYPMPGRIFQISLSYRIT